MIEALVSETADICKSLEWDFHVLEYPNDDMLNGIIFSPPGSEPVVLTFLPSGRLCSPFNLVNKALYGQNGLDTELLYTCSTKTQYAGADTHEILMANPFSGVATPFKVHANGRTYFANCAWDSLGIPAALHTDAEIESACVQSGEPIRLRVMNQQAQGSEALVHFLVPFRDWYNDLTYT